MTTQNMTRVAGIILALGFTLAAPSGAEAHDPVVWRMVCPRGYVVPGRFDTSLECRLQREVEIRGSCRAEPVLGLDGKLSYTAENTTPMCRAMKGCYCMPERVP